MSFHRIGLRMAQQQLRAPAFTRQFVRRLTTEELKAASTGGKLVGPADNAFNRERAAVKAHAAATAGTCCKDIFIEHSAKARGRNSTKHKDGNV